MVVSHGVVAPAIDTRRLEGTLIDVLLTVLSPVSGAGAVTGVSIDHVGADSIVLTRGAITVVNVGLTVQTIKARQTVTLVILQIKDVGAMKHYKHLTILTNAERSETHVPPLLQ